MDMAMQIKEQTFLREKDRLLGFIRNRVSSMEEAEDILQDVFYQFVAGYDTIESLDRVTSWLFSVARNKIIDRYRRDASRPQRTDLAEDFAAALNAEPKAAAFFDDLAQFYRKGYLAWIDATKKKPEERVRRIRETVKLLKAGKKERPK